MASIHAAYTGSGELILSNPLGEPDFVVKGTLEEAKLVIALLWEQLALETFEADKVTDPDWDTFDDVTYACSPLGYWVALKPIELRSACANR